MTPMPISGSFLRALFCTILGLLPPFTQANPSNPQSSNEVLVLRISEHISPQNRDIPQILTSTIRLEREKFVSSLILTFHVASESEIAAINIRLVDPTNPLLQKSESKFISRQEFELWTTTPLQIPPRWLESELKTKDKNEEALFIYRVRATEDSKNFIENLTDSFKKKIVFVRNVFAIHMRIDLSLEDETDWTPDYIIAKNLADNEDSANFSTQFIDSFLRNASFLIENGADNFKAPFLLKNSSLLTKEKINEDQELWRIRFRINNETSDLYTRATVFLKSPSGKSYAFSDDTDELSLIPTMLCNNGLCEGSILLETKEILRGTYFIDYVQLCDNFRNTKTYYFDSTDSIAKIEIKTGLEAKTEAPLFVSIDLNSVRKQLSEDDEKFNVNFSFEINQVTVDSAYVFFRGEGGHGGASARATCQFKLCSGKISLYKKNTSRGHYYISSISFYTQEPFVFLETDGVARVFIPTTETNILAPTLNISSIRANLSESTDEKIFTLRFTIGHETSDVWNEALVSLRAPNGSHASFASARCIEGTCILKLRIDKNNLLNGVYYVDSIGLLDAFQNYRKYEFTFELAKKSSLGFHVNFDRNSVVQQATLIEP